MLDFRAKNLCNASVVGDDILLDLTHIKMTSLWGPVSCNHHV